MQPFDVNLPVPENVMALNDDEDAKRLSLWALKLARKMEESTEDVLAKVGFAMICDNLSIYRELLVSSSSEQQPVKSSLSCVANRKTFPKVTIVCSEPRKTNPFFCCDHRGTIGPPKFLAYLVILCFERRCPKQNSAAR